MPLTPPGATHWFIAHADGKRGPFAASELARMIDDGELAWDSLVWREGLVGWTALGTDHALVTALAAVRGAFADTTVGSAPVPGEDTIVEPTLEASTQMFEPSKASQAPRSAPSAPRSAPPLPAASALSANRTPGAAQETGPHAPVPARSPVPHSWMPSVRSMLLVAGLAFVFGVVVAALWGRLLRGATSHEQIVFPSLRLGEAREPLSETSVAEGLHAPSITPQSEPVEPPSEALKHEIRRIALDVRRCLPDPSQGVQVEATVDGGSGRASEVRVVTGGLPPGAAACVIQALHRLQVPPFSAEPLRVSHRFVW